MFLKIYLLKLDYELYKNIDMLGGMVHIVGPCCPTVFLVMEYNVENLFDCRHDSLKNDLEFMPDSPRGWNYGKFRKK